MPPRPGWIGDLGVANPLLELCLCDNWNCQPLQPVRRLDYVAVAPVPFGELDVVEQHELVDPRHHIEIALPGDVARLHDRDALADIRVFPGVGADAWSGHVDRT